MSQKKVDEYKKYKQNRRQNIKKEKRISRIKTVAAWAVVVLVFGGIAGAVGYSIYDNHMKALAAIPTYSTTSYMLGDYAGIQTLETETETLTGEAETAEDTSVEADLIETDAEEETTAK